MCSFIWCFNGFPSSIKEINRLIWKGMSNIYYWEKLTFSKLWFSWKENLRKCTTFEEQKSKRYVLGNVYISIVVLSYLSSTKLYLRFQLNCFLQQINGFYQSSFRNEVHFRYIMNVSLDIVDERAMIKTTIMSSCHWRNLAPFCLRKKRPENALLTLTVNYHKFVQKNKLCHSKQQ